MTIIKNGGRGYSNHRLLVDIKNCFKKMTKYGLPLDRKLDKYKVMIKKLQIFTFLFQKIRRSVIHKAKLKYNFD